MIMKSIEDIHDWYNTLILKYRPYVEYILNTKDRSVAMDNFIKVIRARKKEGYWTAREN